ncbi:MAG: N-6 DNA methylase [Anaerolineae bacterium]|nr:N-6 DNA methylase [Anaerolineae bacterium]
MFTQNITAKFALPVSFSPEDQLKEPVAAMLKAIGDALHLKVEVVTEVHVTDLAGRPDMGVAVKSLLTGHVELKAPGKGANTKRLRGADRRQWEKFKDLPNLVYTDGNEWALYRNGERVGKLVRLSGDVTTDGRDAVSRSDAEALLELCRDFLYWEPITPSTARALAEMLAPICRLLRSDVLDAIQNSGSNLSGLAADWRRYLFPDADDMQFADAYAQTLTYAFLLAQLSGADSLSVPDAAKAIRGGHQLLADALKILGYEAARQEIEVPVSLLERMIAAVDVEVLMRKSPGDLWLYFYEDFLAAYDPRMRKDRGVYYTPVEVVRAQVRLVAHLLADQFDAQFSFVDSTVITLDPAAGTGTYVLTAVEHGLKQVSDRKGSGMRATYATTAAKNVHAFEILVGPYAVAHLRLTQQIFSQGGRLPADGAHVYLTDTLESPYAPPPQLPTLYRPLGEEHRRAQQVKAKTPVLVCIGNPPYDRQQIAAGADEKRKGGWVRFGDADDESDALLKDFIEPLAEYGLGVHAKNLYNDYVYFWRWALWKVFETKSGPGIVSFITASSYLRGPGFAGVRKVMRETFDDLWILDLEGDNLGARKTDNVFAIRTPVAIAIGVRYGAPQRDTPANVYYSKIEGTHDDKLAVLDSITRFEDLPWRECLSGWIDVFLPRGESDYWDWPLLTNLFPWQENGMQFKRTWPIGESREVLTRRWEKLLSLPAPERGKALKETGARKTSRSYPTMENSDRELPPIQTLKPGVPPHGLTRYAYRSFDRHWVLRDNRLCDRPRPTLQSAHGEKQVYLTSLLTKVMGTGPAAVATEQLPDLDYFCNRGAKDVIPLWRNAAATDANITGGVLRVLGQTYGYAVAAEDFFAYCYALLVTPAYVRKFWDELTIPGPRIPITKDSTLFEQVAALGRNLLWLHTYGERYVPTGRKPGRLPAGFARCKVGTPATPEEYPEEFAYDPAKKELHVGKGIFENVRPEVWDFSVSGLEVVKSWLAYRMRNRAGRSSSPLDDIRPAVWQFDEELLDLLWVLDATVDLLPQVAEALKSVLASDLFVAADFSEPTDAERQGPKGDLPLFTYADIEVEATEEEGDE